MAEEKTPPSGLSLTLQVMNGNELESGRAAKCLFSAEGGVIGHSEDTFTGRFNGDGGAMVYRVHTDTEDNPFSGGLFSQFRLPDTLY